MRSSFSSVVSSRSQAARARLKAKWRFYALGCAAVGGVGVLWLPGAAQAPAIVPQPEGRVVLPTEVPEAAPLPQMGMAPITRSALPEAALDAAPTPRIRSVAQREETTISFEIRDAPVRDLLMLIAGQGDVQLTIGKDVDAAMVVPFIRLNDVTAQEAIQEAALSADLQWKKTGPKRFFVGKVLPASLAGNNFVNPSSGGGIQPIDPNWLEMDVPTQRLGGSINALPSYGNPVGLVPLAHKNEPEEREIRPIRIRNVRSNMMAWWLDRNQPLPIEIQASMQGQADSISRYPLKSAVDPGIMASLNGNSSGMMPFANPYATGFANPYVNPGAANAWNQPVYRSNFLFGGGGGGGGGGIGGRGGNNGGGNQNGGGLTGVGLLELGVDAQGRQLVDQIVSIDAQNVLLVYGTPDGIRKLQTIIDFLDRPIRQVEIESQFIDISVSDAKAFGIQFFNRTDNLDNTTGTGTGTNNTLLNTGPPNGIGTLPGVAGANQLTLTRGQFQVRLQALASSGNARVINSPRVTTMNNLTASLVSSQQTPVVLTATDTGIGGQVGTQQNAFFLTTIIGIQVTPTIQNDDTITVFLTPQVSVQSPTPTLTSTSTGGTGTGTGNGTGNNSNQSTASSIPTVSSQFLTTVANVKDNDVIVLGGLRTRTQNIANARIPILSKLPLIGRFFRSKNVTDVDRELVIFLTARILRRSDDVTPIQGP